VDRALLPRPRDRAHDDTGTRVPTVVDYKVKTSVHTQARADRDPQAGLYLAGRWLAGQPAREFCFAQIAKPGICRFQHMPGYVAVGIMLLSTLAVGR
jgi:hypothetical protein